MNVIGIETSGLSGSVALHREGQCLQLQPLEQKGRRHAQSLVLELQHMLSRFQIQPKDVDAIAVSRGPGSFTGLRVGLVCAKTFAYVTGCQFVAVDTFATVAMNCPPEIDSVWIVEDAQRGDLFAGCYQRTNAGNWVQSDPIQVVDAEVWLSERRPTEAVAGRGLLRQDLSSVAAHCLTADEFVRPTASAVARRGEYMLTHRNLFTDADFDLWKAIPFYIRPSAAEEQRDKRDAATQ